MQERLVARGICKRFGATVALDSVDLSVAAGEVHALVGENGSGKSTLVKILAGVQEPDQGTMSLNGVRYRPRSPLEARRAGISMIHQELTICGDLSIAENIGLGAEPNGFGVLRRSEMRRVSREALALLGYPDLDPEIPAKSLSIAMRQVVEIARAVAAQSPVIILDEPTSSLSQEDGQRLFALVERLREQGRSIVYISHFLDEIRRLADRITVLRDGSNAGEGTLTEWTDEEIMRRMVGRELGDLYPRGERTPGEVILAVEGLRGLVRPAAASFELRRGEVLGIAGLNGSGRTELLRTIFGLDPIRSGKVSVQGLVLSPDPKGAWHRDLGFLSEDRKDEGLWLNLPIGDNIAGPEIPKRVSQASLNRLGDEWIGKLSIRARHGGQAVGELSGGNQQKVALARLLEMDCDVLLLDEPTRGIDVGSKQQIYEWIDRLAREGKAVLVVSSYLPELLGICDRIAVMNRGVLGDPIEAGKATQEALISEAIR